MSIEGIWHDLGRLAFACPGTDRCWACRLAKRTARRDAAATKRREHKAQRRDGKRAARGAP